MKFSKIVFTHPIAVPFLGDNGRPHSSFAHSVGSLTTSERGATPPIDSIEEAGQWVIATFRGQRKAIPASKVDCADLEDETTAKPRKKGEAA